ncbi:MAG: anhydro-N-acetylmuramic acid kinase [Bacteroidales bacterium]|nr:anhydro-N-acetylmuramic acid kinase [Bacteroidales bacterium]
MSQSSAYTVIGVMSGTSLDGLDLACCRFTVKDHTWSYVILAAETLTNDSFWKKALAEAWNLSDVSLRQLDKKFGQLIGEQVLAFIKKHGLQADLIASHGHTVFHRPDKGITLQIGDGAAIAAISGLPTVNNFRQQDVSKGGQGAPLVPIGDQLLFAEYAYCLNIGGIANISFELSGLRHAFDICPANQVLNYFAQQIGESYDPMGKYAADGKLLPEVLDKLDALEYYRKPYPKSLGREWIESEVLPLLANPDISPHDYLHSFCVHIARQIALALKGLPKGRILVTGGGAFNRFLIQQIEKYLCHSLVLPDALLIEYKEALVFALLGLLRWRGEINCLSSVTGATEDSSAGDIYPV